MRRLLDRLPPCGVDCPAQSGPGRYEHVARGRVLERVCVGSVMCRWAGLPTWLLLGDLACPSGWAGRRGSRPGFACSGERREWDAGPLLASVGGGSTAGSDSGQCFVTNRRFIFGLWSLSCLVDRGWGSRSTGGWGVAVAPMELEGHEWSTRRFVT